MGPFEAYAAAAAKPAPKPSEQPIAYADLAHHVGELVIVHTKFGTTRSGMLLRHNGTSMDLSMSADGKTTELTIPASTVRSVALPVTAPAVPESGNPSAKKK